MSKTLEPQVESHRKTTRQWITGAAAAGLFASYLLPMQYGFSESTLWKWPNVEPPTLMLM
ncbi:MAG TPA: hypothetical protein VFS66_02825 [Acidimicrobiia bacterium]|nr:hypothetical protein [Acidimicrobiia bacterium]